MANVAYIEKSLKHLLEDRANVLARETGCIERQRKFSGADLLQTLVFGWLSHPGASLETLASVAALREVSVTDTAVQKRFNERCAHFLHAVLEEMTSIVVTAPNEVPLALLRRFSSVVLEDSSSIALPNELAASWQGCGGQSGRGQAALKLHVRWELKRGQLRGPSLTSGRTDDRSSPFKQDLLEAGSLFVADLGYVDWTNVAVRRAAGSYTLTRAPAHTAYWTQDGQRLPLEKVLPQQVGESKDIWVRVGTQQKHLMRLLLLRVPAEVAERRRASLRIGCGPTTKAGSAESLATGRLDNLAH